MRPVISLFSSAIYTGFWTTVYERLQSTNRTPFEIIFVGNIKPTFKLPSNCHHIYSEVKPSQCFHIAAKEAQGDLLLNFADDCLYSPGALDNMSNICSNNPDAIATAAYPRDQHFFYKRRDTPLLPVGSMLTKELWNDLGGIDSRFVCLYWDVDIAMRLIARGGKIIMTPQTTIEDTTVYKLNPPENKIERVSKYNSFEDRTQFYDLWTVAQEGIRVSRRTIRSQRADPIIQNFEDNDTLLTRSQGKQGQGWT